MITAIKRDLKNLSKIPLKLDWTFFALLVFLPLSHFLMQGKILGMASLIVLPTLFLFVLLHEYGHCWAAQRRGLHVRSVKLWFLGGLATIEGLQYLRPKDEAFVAIMGPVVNFIIAGIAGIFMLVFGSSVFLLYVIVMNQVLGGFNLIPAFPMDGGRILRSYLHHRSGNYIQATHSAANIGLVISFAFFFMGLVMGSFMLMLVFWVYRYDLLLDSEKWQFNRLINLLPSIAAMQQSCVFSYLIYTSLTYGSKVEYSV